MIEENFNSDWGQHREVGLKEPVVVVTNNERDFFFFLGVFAVVRLVSIQPNIFEDSWWSRCNGHGHIYGSVN